MEQMQYMLLKSLYDYRIANNGASYQLPAAMLAMEPASKVAIDALLNEGLAENTSEEDAYLLLHITEKGIEEIESGSEQ